MKTVIVLLISIASVLAGPARNGPQRIVGGQLTTIQQHSYVAAMLSMSSTSDIFTQNCGGSILNEKTILSAAQCYTLENADPSRWRVRVGSSFSQSGGVVHNVARVINHPEYHNQGRDFDISVLHLATFLVYTGVVQPSRIPSSTYWLQEDGPIRALGWGITEDGLISPQLKIVQLRVSNQQVCEQSYPDITDNMLCLSADDAGQGTCHQDSGGPAVDRLGIFDIIVGIVAFRQDCGIADRVPEVTTRVSRFTDWIVANQFTD